MNRLGQTYYVGRNNGAVQVSICDGLDTMVIVLSPERARDLVRELQEESDEADLENEESKISRQEAV